MGPLILGEQLQLPIHSFTELKEAGTKESPGLCLDFSKRVEFNAIVFPVDIFDRSFVRHLISSYTQ